MNTGLMEMPVTLNLNGAAGASPMAPSAPGVAALVSFFSLLGGLLEGSPSGSPAPGEKHQADPKTDPKYNPFAAAPVTVPHIAEDPVLAWGFAKTPQTSGEAVTAGRAKPLTELVTGTNTPPSLVANTPEPNPAVSAQGPAPLAFGARLWKSEQPVAEPPSQMAPPASVTVPPPAPATVAENPQSADAVNNPGIQLSPAASPEPPQAARPAPLAAEAEIPEAASSPSPMPSATVPAAAVPPVLAVHPPTSGSTSSDAGHSQHQPYAKPAASEPESTTSEAGPKPVSPVREESDTGRAMMPDTKSGASAPLPVPADRPLAAPAAVREPDRAATIEPEPLVQAVSHGISLRLGNGQNSVDIKMNEHGGEIRVLVQTPDRELANSLRGDLPDLVGRLRQGGFQAETWHPAASAQTDNGRRGSDAFSGSPQQQSGGGRQGGRQQRQPQSNQWAGEWQATLEPAQESTT